MLTSGDIWRRGRRGCLRRRGGRGEEEEEGRKKRKEGRKERRTAYIKSNNPHLTGGEYLSFLVRSFLSGEGTKDKKSK